MKIMIATAGSRGDVQPYLALGRGLRDAGHSVAIVTDPLFESFVRGAGLDFTPVSADPRKVLQDDVRQIGSNPLRFILWLNRNFKPLARQYFQQIKDAAAGADALLFSMLSFAAAHTAEAYGIPALAAYLQPLSPTYAFPSASMSHVPAGLPFQGQLNWASHRLTTLSYMATIIGTVNECRRDILGLPALPWSYFAGLDYSRSPVVYGYSRHVLPKPADWGDWLHVTGYWFYDEATNWEPPAELLRFLDRGPAPVYLGFGSMLDQDADAVTRLIVEALALAGQRGILLGGWSALGRVALPDTIHCIDAAPHAWLFPRMAAVVHHGGAGTTAAGLRAGVPAIVVPFFADQAFWGWRVHDLGVAAQPIPRLKLTAERLAGALRSVTSDAGMRRRAEALGVQIRSEDGVGDAVAAIEKHLRAGESHTPYLQACSKRVRRSGG